MQENRLASTKPRSKATILVVDDSPTIRKLVSMTLESRGYCVVVACDGVDGLAKMQEGVPDLILSDISMPRLDGYQFCKVVKSNKETKHIPVIMLSGNDGLFDKVRGKMAGSANYITKPFEPNHLVKEIEKFVKTDRAPAPPPPAKKSAAAQAPATAGRGIAVKPADAEAAKQISKKLSGIYIPTAMPSGSTGASQALPNGAVPAGVGEKQTAPGGAPPPAPAAKRPMPKLNDEPEIKIFYHSESAAAPPPDQAGAPSPANRASDGSGQKRAAAPAAAAPAQASKNISPPAAGVQSQPVRSAPPGAEVRHTAPPAAQPSAAPRAAAQTQPGGIKASCPGCGTIYTNIKPEHIGKYARCKKCQTRFLIS
ncbi:MAG: response regulator [Deltaproteobacteria bacterium]|nr:response regulator [Deltaproteobacteria bacterium]